MKNDAPLHTKRTIRFELFDGIGLWTSRWYCAPYVIYGPLATLTPHTLPLPQQQRPQHPTTRRTIEGCSRRVHDNNIIKKRKHFYARVCVRRTIDLCHGRQEREASARKWRRIYYTILIIIIITFYTVYAIRSMQYASACACAQQFTPRGERTTTTTETIAVYLDCAVSCTHIIHVKRRWRCV